MQELRPCGVEVEEVKRDAERDGDWGVEDELAQADGEVALVEANPDRHEELARIPVFTSKTWNHPVVAHGKLFVRNDEEVACFQLAADGSPGAAGE